MAAKGAQRKNAGVPQSINAGGKTAEQKKAAIVAPTVPTAPNNGAPSTEFVRIDRLGQRQINVLREQPVVTKEQDGKKTIDFVRKEHVETVTQPVLTIDEALKLGPQEWIPFGRAGVGHYTCVVNFRRFIIGPEVAAKLGLRAQSKIVLA